MELSIIIVNYKTPDLLLKCINSIYASDTGELQFEIIIVDNDSNDGSEEIIRNEFKNVVWIQKTENDGFGRANNIGIKHSNGKYILLLNSDIILQPHTIKRCLLKIQKDDTIGVLGCQLLNEDGTRQKSVYIGNGSAFDIIKDNLVLDYFLKFQNKTRKIRALMGSFMLIPREVLNSVGLFDPDFFMYSEEIDLCKRIEEKSYKIFFYDEVFAVHKHKGSTSDKEMANKQMFLSNALLQFKSYGIINYLLYHVLFCFNTITNFFAMSFLDKGYRDNFWLEQKYYFSNVIYYFTIPFLFKRRSGNGKRLLRRN